MHPTLQWLHNDRPVLLDGAWGTQLQARGLPVGTCPDAWNLERPELVAEVARAYVDAGSRVILSNTLGANRYVLERHGLADRVKEVARAGAAISRQAAGANVRVFASMGPSGKMLMMGDVTAEELAEAFAEQAAGLKSGGADGIVVETMSDLDEAVCALRASKGTGLPVVVCMTYGAGKDGDRTMTGVTPEQAANVLADAGADAVGTNCGDGPAGMVAVVRRLRASTDLPIWAKPNAGRPKMVDGSAVYDITPEEFAAGLRALADAGADLVGGCCGSSPELIRAARALLPAGEKSRG